MFVLYEQIFIPLLVFLRLYVDLTSVNVTSVLYTIHNLSSIEKSWFDSVPEMPGELLDLFLVGPLLLTGGLSFIHMFSYSSCALLASRERAQMSQQDWPVLEISKVEVFWWSVPRRACVKMNSALSNWIPHCVEYIQVVSEISAIEGVRTCSKLNHGPHVLIVRA